MRRIAALIGALLAGPVLCPSVAVAGPVRNDYANLAFSRPLNEGFEHFYKRDFHAAADDFSRALKVIDDNTLAIAFLAAACAQQPPALDALIAAQEDAVTTSPKSYGYHVQLGFFYMFASLGGLHRLPEAREEFNAAVNVRPAGAGAHVGLGILSFDERRARRAKSEFLAALRDSSNDVLAREYLGQLYQSDLHDPRRSLSYEADIPNLVPGYADILFHMGSLLLELDRPDAALAYVQRGIALDGGHVGEAGLHGYVLAAHIYIRERKLDEAKQILRHAIDVGADAIVAKQLLLKIEHGDYQDQKRTSDQS